MSEYNHVTRSAGFRLTDGFRIEVDDSSRLRRFFARLGLAKRKARSLTAHQYFEETWRRTPTEYPPLFERRAEKRAEKRAVLRRK